MASEKLASNAGSNSKGSGSISSSSSSRSSDAKASGGAGDGGFVEIGDEAEFLPIGDVIEDVRFVNLFEDRAISVNWYTFVLFILFYFIFFLEKISLFSSLFLLSAKDSSTNARGIIIRCFKSWTRCN